MDYDFAAWPVHSLLLALATFIVAALLAKVLITGTAEHVKEATVDAKTHPSATDVKLGSKRRRHVRGEVCDAFWRLFAGMPLFVTILITVIAGSTVWYAWWHPLPTVGRHSDVELYVFIVEVSLLMLSYIFAVVAGPGFVPLEWKPPKDEWLLRAKEIREYLPLQCTGSAAMADCLRFCKHCNGYKPPRSHHCSTCRRCVHWMDHHCPWINTCVGFRNLKAFVIFTHCVPVACLHSAIIHIEMLVYLGMGVYRASDNNKLLLTLRVLMVPSVLGIVVVGIVAIATMALVGCLAWDIEQGVTENSSFIEEGYQKRSEERREGVKSKQEAPLQYPYDLGWRKNWQIVFGSNPAAWLLPTFPNVDPFWPPVREGSRELDFSMEQLVQKAHAMSLRRLWTANQGFEPPGCCGCAGAARIIRQFGLSTGCGLLSCGEKLLRISAGERFLMSSLQGTWMYGQLVKEGDLVSAATGPQGWIPVACTNDTASRARFKVPSQDDLQGKWETQSGRLIHVVGIIVYVEGSDSRGPPFALGEAWGSPAGEVGSPSAYRGVVEPELVPVATLQGSKLLQCNEELALWSSGDIWKRRKGDDST
eukprot:TRINITY_DN22685_c1_g1_i1.p1 TRINITY_DN22685_c1_g1~~TRINITY_DN22685_c1_g1_i1.p1  ORF type:complete len:590 (+),score=74.93 TRINITY_DN22685_c1_g1_i1:84-1853(+)